MNYRRQILSYQSKRGADVYRNILLILFTTVFILVCGLVGSSIAGSGQSEAAQNNSYKYYTSIEIEKGDTLWDIAEHYMTPEYRSIETYVDDIKKINHLGDDAIHAGQYLLIPYFSKEHK